MTELTIIEFTSDVLVNQYVSMFVYITGVLCTFFGAFSLMSK